MASKENVIPTEPEHANSDLPPATVAAVEKITAITCSYASQLRAVNEALEK